jgi:hypothetical protein
MTKLMWVSTWSPLRTPVISRQLRGMSMFNRLRSWSRLKPAITDAYEQFVVAFIEECERQGRKPISYDHHAGSFVFGDTKGKSHTVFPENIFRMWVRSDALSRGER